MKSQIWNNLNLLGNFLKEILHSWILRFIFEKRYSFVISSILVSQNEKSLDNDDNINLKEKNDIYFQEQIVENKGSFFDSVHHFATDHPIIFGCIVIGGSICIAYIGYQGYLGYFSYDNPNVLDTSVYSPDVQHYFQMPFERWDAPIMNKVYNEVGPEIFGTFVDLTRIPSKHVDLFLTLKEHLPDTPLDEILIMQPIPQLSPELLDTVQTLLNNL